MTPPPLLEVQGLRKAFGLHQVLTGIDTTVARGEVRAVIGPNGAGKTTFINVLTGIHKPTAAG